jgi:AcrR family transcriptional regulator
MSQAMMATAKPRLDADARREAIIDVAQEVFVEEGFAAASMSAIAARLGGSKGTLYNYFKNKDELFEACVERRCFWHQAKIFGELSPQADARETLRSIAAAYLRVTLSDDSLRGLRLIIAEAERAPEIGRRFYESGPMRGAQRLARLIEGWVRAGELKAHDPMEAAQFFLGLCKGRYYMTRVLGVTPELTDEEIEIASERAVTTFFCVHGPQAA